MWLISFPGESFSVCKAVQNMWLRILSRDVSGDGFDP